MTTMTNKTTEMTMKAFLTGVLATEGLAPELADKAQLELDKLAAKLAKRKTSEKAMAKSAADADLKSTMLSLMGDTPVKAGELAILVTETTGTSVSTPKVAAMLKALVADGKVISKKTRSKGREVSVYTKVADTDTDTAESIED